MQTYYAMSQTQVSNLNLVFSKYQNLGLITILVHSGQFHSTTVPVFHRDRFPMATQYQVLVLGFHIKMLVNI